MSERRAVRPRDAAGLVLLRGEGKRREVLLGRRRRSARFLPGVYVFPGGVLELHDRVESGFREDWSGVPDGIDAATRRKAFALLRAAFRETYEETGVLVGRQAGPSDTPPPAACSGPVWQAYAASGLMPAFDSARLLVRAITPTASPIRFHTRFFLLEAKDFVQGEPCDNELEDVAWVPLSEVERLPMIDVTESVLALAKAGAGSKAPLLTYRNDRLRDDLRRRLVRA